MDEVEKSKIIFQPSGRRGEVKKGVTIIEASRQLGVDIESLCGEKKVCGKCKIRIEEGFFEKYGIQSSKDHAGEWLMEEEKFINREQREAGYRLGCCARIEGDLLVFVPEESRAGKQIVSKAARDIQIEWNPAVEYYYVELSEPTIQEPTGDLERILEALNHKYGLKNLDIDYLTLQRLPNQLRKGKWKVTVAIWMDKEILHVLPGKIKDYYGMAIDVGTTTVAAYLCNIATMEVLDTVSMMNPQCKYGEDVMSRITYHMMHQDGLAKMSADIITGLNSLVTQACEATHPPKKGKKNGSDKEETIKTEKDTQYLCLNPTDIIDMTIVGNTAMHHILLKLNPKYVGMAPFPPVVHKSMDIKARDLRIQIHESAYVHILPNEAGFVGADNVGVLIAEEPYKKNEMQLIIDIGTNGELVLGNKKKLISSSCATGPALEGAQLTFGMRAAPGAIERIKIDPDSHEVDYKVIGRDTWKTYSKSEEMQTKGICGSGILDLFAELYRSGVILKSGKFNPNQKNSRFRKNSDNNQPEFVIAWANETTIGKDIVITQKDIRQIQLAKGALYCGCKLMMRRMGIDKVEKVKIAGAFGTHVDREKALIMGLFPDCEIDKIISIGNAAGDGARAALLNREKREEANWVSRNVEYIELTVEKDFQQQFMEAMQIPHMKDQFEHLKGIVPDEILNQ
ncbi:MAG TPA: ASKHA domain-containing protein [Desulfatiglandales bacterium]|nr:ASKHA domain-containing protein [Desulfatiglandales bacterium]